MFNVRVSTTETLTHTFCQKQLDYRNCCENQIIIKLSQIYQLTSSPPLPFCSILLFLHPSLLFFPSLLLFSPSTSALAEGYLHHIYSFFFKD